MQPPRFGWQWRVDPPPLRTDAAAETDAAALPTAAVILSDSGQRLQDDYRQAMRRHFREVPDRTVAVMTLERLARSVAVPVLRFAAEHGKTPHATLDDIGFEVVEGWVSRVGWVRRLPSGSITDLAEVMWRLHQELLALFVPVVAMTPQRRWLVISEGAETAVQQVGMATDVQWWARWWKHLTAQGLYVPAVGERIVYPRPVRRVCCFGHALRPRPEPAWCDSCPALFGRAGALVKQ